MASVDDYEELIATRRLNGLNDNLYKESDKPVANDKDYTLAYLKGYADAEEKYRKKIKDLKENIVLEPTIVGGRKNRKTLEYGIKLGKIKVCEELLEENNK